MRICSISGCSRGGKLRRGMCQRHYYRWRVHGDPSKGNTKYSTPEEAFKARTEWQGECLEWTGGGNERGYGTIWAKGRSVYAHRYAWERVNGPISEGMFLDHTCYNPPCVNVEHLRLATVAQNNQNRRGAHVNSQTGMRGVFPKGGGRFQVQVKGVHLGTYASLEEAQKVATKARKTFFGEFSGGD